MKVIVAGMPKTGTKSMTAALTKLGYSVYDYPENSILLGDEYTKIIFDGWTSEDFRRMYEDVDAVTDSPACYFWDEIHKAFPESKIILTIRDNEDEWLRSWDKQMQAKDQNVMFRLMHTLSPTAVKIARFMTHMDHIGFGIAGQSIFRRKTKLNKELCKRLYRQHNAYVMHCAPKDKLLVYKCSEGWEPLCKFLGVPIPDDPFPHKNKGAKYVEEWAKEVPLFRKLRIEALTSLIVLSTTAIGGGVLVYKYGVSGVLEGIGACADRIGRKSGLY